MTPWAAGGTAVAFAAGQTGWVQVAFVVGALAALAVVLGVYAHRARMRERHARRLELLEDEVIRSAQTVLDPEQRTDLLLRLVETRHGPPPPPPEPDQTAPP